jgi:hypothetical protein
MRSNATATGGFTGGSGAQTDGEAIGFRREGEMAKKHRIEIEYCAE